MGASGRQVEAWVGGVSGLSGVQFCTCGPELCGRPKGGEAVMSMKPGSDMGGGVMRRRRPGCDVHVRIAEPAAAGGSRTVDSHKVMVHEQVGRCSGDVML